MLFHSLRTGHENGFMSDTLLVAVTPAKHDFPVSKIAEKSVQLWVNEKASDVVSFTLK